METEEHAGYRAAWGAVQQFELQHRFPLVKQRYFESTIGRMVDKGQPEVRWCKHEPLLLFVDPLLVERRLISNLVKMSN